MDSKNMWIGWGLIALIFFGFTMLNRPSQEELERIRRANDSMAIAAQKAIDAENARKADEEKAKQIFAQDDSDSLKMEKAKSALGDFYQALLGEETTVMLSNENVSVTLTSCGAKVKSVRLNNFKDYNGNTLSLVSDDESSFNLVVPVAGRRPLNSEDMKFQVKSKTDTSVVFTVPAGDGKSLDFSYVLPKDDYMLKFNISANNIDELLYVENGTVDIAWKGKARQQEKGRDFENRYSALYYKIWDDDVEQLSETGNDNADVNEEVKWVAFKNQFFSSVLVADAKFSSAKLKSEYFQSGDVLKEYDARIKMPYAQDMGFRYYFGPNKYSVLKAYNDGLASEDELDLHRLVPLGWAIFRWVNQLITIPLFNFFGSFLSNYGLIILLLTLVVKLLLFPITYKSYLSTAKMRVLKPQIEEINKRIPEDQPMERQRATMELYSKAGVSPLGGCFPMLMQMPFLIALFYFFPTSIELRGQSFLWADDLSSYDAIFQWDTNIPLVSSWFGNHLSLFCLLMTITNIIYTKINMSMTDTGAQQQMPMMKYMMYFMPIMFLFIFNNYASGLSYYYLVSTLITILQTFAIRKWFIDEDKLLAKLNENQKKPQKKSAWLERLQEMQRQQQEMMKQQQGKK